MDIEKKKSLIRKRLTLAKYPRRPAVDFTVDPDHNPLVLQDCSRCHGTGKECIEGDDISAMHTCTACAGDGITGEIERYFLNDDPPVTVHPYMDGWVRCPCCGYRFSLEDDNVWTGHRHIRCGQRLIIKNKA